MVGSKVQCCSSSSVESRKPPVPTLFLYVLEALYVSQPQSIDVLQLLKDVRHWRLGCWVDLSGAKEHLLTD